MVTMGPGMVMGRTRYRVGTVKAKAKERQRKGSLLKREACLKATENSTRKGSYYATNCSILPLKVSGFLQ